MLIKSLARTVDADWHDSYEETDQELRDYVEGLQPFLQAVLECCALPDCGAAALARCNQVMVEIAESWRQMDGVPFRACMEDSIGDVTISLKVQTPELKKAGDDDDDDDDDDGSYSRKAAVGVVWAELVQAAAARLAADEDETLNRIVKDALDFGVTEKELNGGSGVWRTEGGAARVSALLTSKAGLNALPSRLVPVKRYRVIDRRFFGPKHRRTRDYSDDDSDGGCAQQ